MKYTELIEKKDRYQMYQKQLPPDAFENMVSAFDIRYTHDSTAIEGNTLSLAETKLVLEDGITPSGKKLREVYEVVNHNKAYQYAKQCITEGKELDESIVKEIHAILMDNIQPDGIYRNTNVYISGAQFDPPSPMKCTGKSKVFMLILAGKARSLTPLRWPPGLTLNSSASILLPMAMAESPACS